MGECGQSSLSPASRALCDGTEPGELWGHVSGDDGVSEAEVRRLDDSPVDSSKEESAVASAAGAGLRRRLVGVLTGDVEQRERSSLSPVPASGSSGAGGAGRHGTAATGLWVSSVSLTGVCGAVRTLLTVSVHP